MRLTQQIANQREKENETRFNRTILPKTFNFFKETESKLKNQKFHCFISTKKKNEDQAELGQEKGYNMMQPIRKFLFSGNFLL